MASSLAAPGRFTLGIDIGGTNTCFGIVSPEGEIILRGSLPTCGHYDFQAFADALHKEVTDSLHAAGLSASDLGALGVGAPCVDYRSGEIVGAVDLPWPSPTPLAAVMQATFGLPAHAENDANAAALGELAFGAARGLSDVLVITLGTGVGSAIICDGRLLHGYRGLAGELGHTIAERDSDRLCSCGRMGCLETYASARGVVCTAASMLALSAEESSLRRLTQMTAGDVGRAADNGDPIALRAFAETGKVLGSACAEFAAFCSPQAVIFFGGVARSFHHFEGAMRREYEKNLLWIYRENEVRFLPSTLPEADAAILGAAAVASSPSGFSI